jgi:replication factor C large subunit
MNPENWCEKYRPQHLAEIVGNRNAVNRLYRWALEWKKGIPKKRAALLIGNPGLGKTSSALALAKDFGWELVEMNASDQRNAEKINKIVGEGILCQSIDGNYGQGSRRIIVLDEADNLSETQGKSGDMGGKSAIVKAVRNSMQPIILIVNDSWGLFKGAGRDLRELCENIKFYPPNEWEQASLLKRLCKHEGKSVESGAITHLIRVNRGDLRSTINDLQVLCTGKSVVREEDAVKLAGRERSIPIYEGLKDIFESIDPKLARKKIFELGESPEQVLLWLEENLLFHSGNRSSLAGAFDELSRADIFLGRSIRTQDYSLWKYAVDHMASVASYELNPLSGRKEQAPSWIRKMSETKTRRAKMKELSRKVGFYTHQSSVGAMANLPYFSKIFASDREFQKRMTGLLDLGKDEANMLIGFAQGGRKEVFLE